MRLVRFIFVIGYALAIAVSARAHGPQIQLTGESGKLTTHRLLLDGPYSNTLTAPTSVYVIPLKENLGVWYSRPNGAINSATELPAFYSGPGFAYGYGYDVSNPSATPFSIGAKFQLRLADGLKKWNGADFLDAGATELEAFTGNFSAPTGSLVTSNANPFANLPFPAGTGTISFTASGEEVHDTVRYRMLGDGASPTSAVPDGVYLAAFGLTISTNDKVPSDPFYFVLHKNAEAELPAAIAFLNVPSDQVQFVVPEPATAGLGILSVALITAFERRRKAASRP